MKSSITSNVDTVGLTSQQRAQREKDERHDAQIQTMVDRAQREGPKVREIGDNLLITHDQQADTKAYAAGDRKFIQPIGYKVGPQYPGGFHWVLTDADTELIRQGLACQRCLDMYPATWTPACGTCHLER